MGSFLFLYLCIKRGMDILSGYETNHAHQANSWNWWWTDLGKNMELESFLIPTPFILQAFELTFFVNPFILQCISLIAYHSSIISFIVQSPCHFSIYKGGKVQRILSTFAGMSGIASIRQILGLCKFQGQNAKQNNNL